MAAEQSELQLPREEPHHVKAPFGGMGLHTIESIDRVIAAPLVVGRISAGLQAHQSSDCSARYSVKSIHCLGLQGENEETTL